MKTLLKYTFLFLVLFSTINLRSQTKDYIFRDTLRRDTLINKVTILDSAYFRRDIIQVIQELDYFGSEIELVQKPYIRQKLNKYISNASHRQISGYRIRIFFNNNQQARAKSEQVVGLFSEQHPGIGVYRTYDNPYFKVTVGDLRTKSHAVKMLKEIEREYPSAFIVRENINFPPL